ncbi:MAG TPA: SRPBCC family protein, partial [Beijerinckiaceae bacterium]
MKTLAVVVIVLAVAVAAVLVLAAKKPATFRIARSIRIAAPPQRIFALIDDFRAWSAWSPWEKMDPALKRTHGGAPRGTGAVYAWEGNRKVGQGRMEIVEASPPSRIAIRLDFLKPFEAHNTAEFTLVPEGDATGAVTEVTWAMTGPNVFMGKVMGVFVDMDRMIGRDFERGLANLKAAAEGSPSS